MLLNSESDEVIDAHGEHVCWHSGVCVCTLRRREIGAEKSRMLTSEVPRPGEWRPSPAAPLWAVAVSGWIQT